eukprot:jgi/Ulvmu1/11014/UM007_0194.1
MERLLGYHRACHCSRPQPCCSTRASVSQLREFGIESVSQSDDCGDMLFGVAAARPSVAFRSELWSTSDRDVLERSMRSWRSRASELCPFYQEEVTDVNQLQPDSFEVKWKATWVPRQLLWLDSLGKAWPGVSVEYYDVLDRYDQRTQFKWRALFKLFAAAFSTGVLRIPTSAIEAVWSVRVTADTVSITERCWLIPMLQQLRVKNRRIARDMLIWQEVRQPADTVYRNWDDTVMTSLQIDEVPGMGQFDIDGLDETGRDNVYGDVIIIMGFAVVIILSFGLSYAMIAANQAPSFDPYGYVLSDL